MILRNHHVHLPPLTSCSTCMQQENMKYNTVVWTMNSGNSNYFNYSNKVAFPLFPSDPLFSVSILSRLSITKVHTSYHTLSSFYSQKRRFNMRNAQDSFDRRSKRRCKIISKIRGNLLEFAISVRLNPRVIYLLWRLI